MVNNGSGNGLVPIKCIATILTNVDVSTIKHSGTELSEILIKILIFLRKSIQKCLWKIIVIFFKPPCINRGEFPMNTHAIIMLLIHQNDVVTSFWCNDDIISCVCWVVITFVRQASRTHRPEALLARFMGPSWGPSGADRTQVGPMLAPWSLLSGRGNYRLLWIFECYWLTVDYWEAS